MRRYDLSDAADEDLSDIYTFTYSEFGERQADAYFQSLEECLERLAQNPRLGRDAASLRKGYRLFVHKRHSIYFTQNVSGIFIVRVLGPGMVADRNLP